MVAEEPFPPLASHTVDVHHYVEVEAPALFGRVSGSIVSRDLATQLRVGAGSVELHVTACLKSNSD